MFKSAIDETKGGFEGLQGPRNFPECWSTWNGVSCVL